MCIQMNNSNIMYHLKSDLRNSPTNNVDLLKNMTFVFYITKDNLISLKFKLSDVYALLRKCNNRAHNVKIKGCNSTLYIFL